MGIFSSGQEEKVMGSFILSEIRDLRKGMEGRDGELRGEIRAVTDAVVTLSESVSRSHNKVDSMRGDMEAMANNVGKLRVDVDAIQQVTHIRDVEKSSEWNGPKKIIGIIAAGATAIGGTTVLINFWPAIVATLTF